MFLLLWKENYLKHQKVLKYYKSGCLKKNFNNFEKLSLLTTPIDKDSDI